VKVLVVSRLFSGFAQPLANGHWPPAGAPAIYKLLEGLADDPEIELSVIFTAKDARTDAMLDETTQSLTIPRLGVTARVLRFHAASPVREFLHAVAVLIAILRLRPDATYFTNANLVAAALAARFGVTQSILRFMGLFPHEKAVADGGGRAIVRWLYRSPFSLALCTEEGSGAKIYLPRLLKETVPLHVVLNGVDAPETPGEDRAALCSRAGLPDDRPLVLFVGRLESYKGALEFGRAVQAVLSDRPDAFTAVMIGNGSCLEQLQGIRQEIEGAGGCFHLAGDVPHDRVLAWYRASDVYVSLNMHGNLSNANLEAIACGVCLVLPESDPKTSTDLVTDELIPADAAIRLPRNDTAVSLAGVLMTLVDDPERRKRMRKALAKAAPRLSQSWATRIRWELDTIAGLTDRRQPAKKS